MDTVLSVGDDPRPSEVLETLGAPVDFGTPLSIESQLRDRRHFEQQPGDGVALCLSGSGYRAMLFHLGGIIRLNEMGQLRSIARVSSVSGGSITAGTLGMVWGQLRFSGDDVAQNLDELLVQPIRSMATKTIDKKAIIASTVRPGRTVGQIVAKAFDEHLFHGTTLQDLPNDGVGPRFVINATNVQTGTLFMFSRPYQGDYTVGLWRNPTTRLADAVAASTAIPPALSPHTMAPSGQFDEASDGTNLGDDFRRVLCLSDGGVYDNLALETSWKRHHTILVSDGSGALRVDRKPMTNWLSHGIRVFEIADGQVRAFRKRQLIDSYERRIRAGTYWSIRSNVADYQLADAITLPAAGLEHAQSVTARLAKLGDPTQRDLINWGYVIADAALRKWVYQHASAPSQLPAT